MTKIDVEQFSKVALEEYQKYKRIRNTSESVEVINEASEKVELLRYLYDETCDIYVHICWSSDIDA
ncbi:MAG: hypothetical protein ACRCX2_27875 [Paraclostridium sp.]